MSAPRCTTARVLCFWGALLLSLPLIGTTASALPDHRGYELVSRYEEGGREVGLNGVEPIFGEPSRDGDAFDWETLGGCCGATSGALNLYQSGRGAGGWQTRALTPTASHPLDGLFEEEGAMFWTEDLGKTLWSTPSSFAAGDNRPVGADVHDLYLEGPEGAMSWISQGPLGSGTSLDTAEFDAATPDASKVVFSSAEPLTANATPLATLSQSPQYLYVRDIAHGTTTLVDVDNAGNLLSTDGASLGNAGYLHENLTSTNRDGTSTNAISANGEKVFFETPPPEANDLPEGEVPHLYMRNLTAGTTTPLDDPSSTGSAHYQGASTDGSLVFFTSDEGLDGAPTVKELYEFNTTNAAIGPVPPMSSLPVTEAGGGILGVSAIANDGARVFFVAESVLAPNSNSAGHTATESQPNLYVDETATGHVTFIASLALSDIGDCEPNCGTGSKGGLASELDLEHVVYPTPDGSVLAFESSGALTGPSASPATSLTSEAAEGEHTLTVTSTAGFGPKQLVTIGSGAEEEIDTIESVDGPTQLTLTEYTGDDHIGLTGNHPIGASVTELNYNAYRYAVADNSLTCISCTPAGVTPTGSATMGFSGGGSYAPPQQPVPMNEDGTRIFFTSPDPLVPEADKASTGTGVEPTNVYEWENGEVSLISDGSAAGSILDGTTRSGNDVFITSRARLVPGAVTGDEDIYDARVGGGFSPAPNQPPPCTGQDCRAQTAATTFFAVPASATLPGGANLSQSALTRPAITLAKITPAQRTRLARSGRLYLTLIATGAGRATAGVSARIDGREQRVAHASTTLIGAGRAELLLQLSPAARRALAAKGSLQLRFEVGYSTGGTLEIAELTLKRARASATRRIGGHKSHA